MNKAILLKNGIPYLAPELVLLYKTLNLERKWYQFDYENTINKMNNDQTKWFNNSLGILCPNGHVWRKT